MNPKIFFALSTLCFLAALSTANGLKCYECTSKPDEDCAKGSNLDKDKAKDCASPNDKLCFDEKTDSQFTRGCGGENYCKGKSDCNTCTEDLCNGSSTFSMFNLGVFAVISALLLAIK